MNVAAVRNAIARRWLIVAGVTVAAAALAGILTIMSPLVYTASAEGVVSVSSPQSRPSWALGNGAQYIADRMTSYAQLGTTTPVLLPVYTRLDVRDTSAVHIASEPVPNQAVLRISVTDSDPTQAAHIADAALEELGATITRIENGNVVVTEVTPASIPSAPSNRNITLNAAVAAVAGFVVGVFGAVGLQVLADRRVGRRSAALVGPDTRL
jgi:succinoglycan biosynthesis transport protein ExoP